jgi:hypothetical protein
MSGQFLCPFGAASRIDANFHGLRSVRLSADFASPVATILRPAGAKAAQTADAGVAKGAGGAE